MEEISRIYKQKEKYIGVRMDKELKQWCKKEAAKLGIPLSVYIREVLYKKKDNGD